MKQEREYRICKRCVMDTTDPDIIFDENGYCNHCNDAQIYLNKRYVNRKKNYNTIINELKTNKKYDCIVGISGGVDSSYVLHLLKTSGINPLALHIDNGWNSELSVKNINNLVTNLDIDLITYVIDWEEFRDLQLAY
jgi:3'-phosphoadenosine 5'-phosphosulfate sulfotransferase (PAPS reductase)/FAD synthetase